MIKIRGRQKTTKPKVRKMIKHQSGSTMYFIKEAAHVSRRYS